MATRHTATGAVSLVIYETFWTLTDDLSFVRELSTLFSYADHLDVALAHELGHVLGMDHDNCTDGFMISDIDVLLDGRERSVQTEQCNLLEATHEPPDPLDALNEQGRCRLGGYCTNMLLEPWPLFRSTCGWYIRTEEVTTIDSLGNVTVTVRTHSDYVCLPDYSFAPGGILDPPPIDLDHFNGPSMILANPEQLEVVSGTIEIQGWAWESALGMREIAFWLDGTEIELDNFQMGLYSPEICDSGIDPGGCDPYSGFSGQLDTTTLSNGTHVLLVVGTNWRDPDPLPTPMFRVFEVDNRSDGEAPVAVDDAAEAWVEDADALTVDVVANDFDPDGGVVVLSGEPVVTPPSLGTVIRVSDRELRYEPTLIPRDPESPGEELIGSYTDDFEYEIRDADGETARARVFLTLWTVPQ
jgi:hypothetical protein